MCIMISNQSHHFFQSLLVMSHWACFSVLYTQTAKCVVAWPPSLPVINPFTKMDHQERELAYKGENEAKK